MTQHRTVERGKGEVPDEPAGVASYGHLVALVRDFASKLNALAQKGWPEGVAASPIAAIEVQGAAPGVDRALFERALRESLSEPRVIELQVGRADLPRVAAEARRSGITLPDPLPRDLVIKASISAEPRAGRNAVFVRLQLVDPKRPDKPLVTSTTSTSF